MDGLSSNRVIIVDDDPNVCTAIKEVADRRGLGVAVASDSHQFREIYQSSSHVDVVGAQTNLEPAQEITIVIDNEDLRSALT